jgi:diguanylate cyclase (GGDEF)-like protein/PAS domain S-box-containing protein
MASALPSDAPDDLRGPARAASDAHPPLRSNSAWGLLVLGALVGVASWLSITLTRAQGGASSIWIANGVLLGALVLKPRADWPQAVLAATVGTALARALAGDSLPIVLGLTGASVIEVLMIADGIRRRVPDIRDPSLLPALARASIRWTLVACVVSATIAALVRWLAEGSPMQQVWPVWFVAHLLGVVVVGTLSVTTLRLRWRLLGREGHRADFAVCVAVLAATCVVIGFQHALPVLFLAYLPLMLLTLRHGFAGVVVGIAGLSVAMGLMAGYDLGPFRLVEHATVAQRALLLQLFIGAGCLLTYPTAVSQAERRRLARQVRTSESLYRLLAEHSRDLVVRLRANGERPYVSASSEAVLGWTPEEMAWIRVELLHPDDRVRVQAEIARLFRNGGTLVTTYRYRHKDGHYVWLEASGQRVDTVDPPEIVYAARDVSARVLAEQALLDSQSQLQAVTDNVPAMITHFDADERFTFANAAAGRLLGMELPALQGRRLREVVGEAAYADLAAHVAAALRGEPVAFEQQIELGPRRLDHRTQFVPDRGPDGAVRGFYSISFDITALKQAERQLERLARFDTLTGLANRRHFEESLAEAIARAQRNGTPLVLLAMDIDRFKHINDTHGHAAGDRVLQEFATRLRDCVYEVDLPARLGGDEFVVLMEYSPSVEVGETVARRIHEAMQAPMELVEATLQVTASIGVGVHFPVRSGETLMEVADQALYEAKRAGRDTWRVRQA